MERYFYTVSVEPDVDISLHVAIREGTTILLFSFFNLTDKIFIFYYYYYYFHIFRWYSSGDQFEAMELIGNGADVNAKDGYNMSPLHIAVKKGKYFLWK